ncbi:putative norsolorinic acid reductase [Rhexocercosporidium sp. MPI-PUGE-AT-0058]|nr:putative norsolorinic acid reductase [Rhexocercosporidium sp. MPI-PUGE-AT-0058]
MKAVARTQRFRESGHGQNIGGILGVNLSGECTRSSAHDNIRRIYFVVTDGAANLGFFLSPLASIRVSPLFLELASLVPPGFLGACSKETAFAIIDHYYAAGGNVIDSANYYQNGETEIWLGEWLTSRNNRNDLVLSTKYSSNMMLNTAEQDDNTFLSNYGGNNPKSLKLSIEKSLKLLGMTYIDMIYVHWWDFTTSPAELMRSLNRLVADGTCIAFACHHGLSPFIIYTGRWNVADRDMEREILDMCAAEDMAIAPYEVLDCDASRSANGALSSCSFEVRSFGGNFGFHRAETKNTPPTSIALAYVLQKQAYVFPLVGGRKVEYLQANLKL